ncbi:hypothetical protein MNBD_GAMMA22-3090 [hydrothermal vent metagenome]|uniref:Uncharacterized protein n=1 Tax=hydrothermal vent metagenome TaxID=652676 RepID=A0A3B1AAX8_9ZZZZ
MSKYVKLFEVKILHDYFLNLGAIPHEALFDSIREDAQDNYLLNQYVAIFPTANSNKILAGQQMLFRTTSDGFFVAVRVDDTADDIRPLISLANNFKLEFALKVIDARFFNYTALKSTSPDFYLFKNNSSNSVANELFLSKAVAEFDPDSVYEADQIYVSDSGSSINLFRAIRETGPAITPIAADWELVPHNTYDAAISYNIDAIVLSENKLYRALVADPADDLADGSQWLQFSALANQYVTPLDAITTYSKNINLDVGLHALSQITVKITRNGETDILWQNQFINETSVLQTVQLNLQSLATGHFQLALYDNSNSELSNSRLDFYLSAKAISDNWFGMIHIAAGEDDFALLADDGSLRSPEYKIRFMNRASRWRYIFPQKQTVGTGAEVMVEDSNDQILVTELPRPLTQFGDGVVLQADLSETAEISEEVILPKPEINRIRYQNSQWFSEIFMFNLTL